jgi:hypothetical protein
MRCPTLIQSKIQIHLPPTRKLVMEHAVSAMYWLFTALLVATGVAMRWITRTRT